MVSMHFTKFCFTNWNHTFIGLKIYSTWLPEIIPMSDWLGYIFSNMVDILPTSFYISYYLIHQSICISSFYCPLKLHINFSGCRLKWCHFVVSEAELNGSIEICSNLCRGLKLNSNKTFKSKPGGSEDFQRIFERECKFFRVWLCKKNIKCKCVDHCFLWINVSIDCPWGEKTFRFWYWLTGNILGWSITKKAKHPLALYEIYQQDILPLSDRHRPNK